MTCSVCGKGFVTAIQYEEKFMSNLQYPKFCSSVYCDYGGRRKPVPYLSHKTD